MTCWNLTAAALVCVLGVQLPVAHAQPAPRPPGWPSDLCLAEGVNAINPLCGTCSTSVWFPMDGVGTLIQWTCKHPDDQWMTHSIIRPWMTAWIKPSMADIILKGPWAAMWDANTVPISPADSEKYAALQAKAAPWISTAVRPPEPAPPAWVVAPVSTGQRPSYTLTAAGPVRETGRFVPTVTAGKPTACTCEGTGNSATLGSAKLCAADGYTTTTGAPRLVACIAAPKP